MSLSSSLHMEDCTMMKDDELQEDISDKFLCCVCLELLYKPIVLSCGHLSCFWCVHKSMNGLRESHCPICRDPYVHFPSVCQKLHFLLKKIYPLAHKKREEQVLKEEQEQECFSPQIDVFDVPNACSGNSLNVSDKQKMKDCLSAAKLLSISPSSGNSPRIPSNEETTDAKPPNVHGNDLPKNNKDSKQISEDDLLCSSCKKLLVRPVVLNCGHVYCEGCVVDMAGESEKIKCLECNVCDPRGHPKVCLVLDQLLEENFPEEYNSRRSKVQKTLAHTSKGNSQSNHKEGSSLSANNNNDIPWWANPGSNVHIGAGCDSCGVYPIVGDRYRCKDCKEEIGYDLCKDCYESPLKVPGRFNQQHTPDHRFERADVRQLLLNLNTIGFLLGPMVNTEEEGNESDEEPPPGEEGEEEEEEEEESPIGSNESSSIEGNGSRV